MRTFMRFLYTLEVLPAALASQMREAWAVWYCLSSAEGSWSPAVHSPVRPSLRQKMHDMDPDLLRGAPGYWQVALRIGNIREGPD